MGCKVVFWWKYVVWSNPAGVPIILMLCLLKSSLLETYSGSLYLQSTCCTITRFLLPNWNFLPRDWPALLSCRLPSLQWSSLFSVQKVQTSHITGKVWHLPFCAWSVSFNAMYSKFRQFLFIYFFIYSLIYLYDLEDHSGVEDGLKQV